MKNVAFVAAAFLVLLAGGCGGCKTRSADPPRERVVAQEEVEEAAGPRVARGEEGKEEDDESPDETHDDVAADEEDFDLICDSHVPPNRTRRLPDVVIVGARKGGTRALLEFLKIHPLVRSAGPEIHYFDQNFHRGASWYVEQMPPVEEGQLCAEKTPGYFHHPDAPARARRTVPDARLLLIVRDPVRRLVSDYNQFRTRNLDRGRDYPSLEELALTPEGDVDPSYPPLQRSVYHQHLSRWLAEFPKEQIHVVHGDRFITQPWEELQAVESFLDLPPAITEDNFYFNATKGFFCSRQTRSKGVWECTMRKCLSKSKGRPKPPLLEDTAAKLGAFYRPHNKVFEDMVGREFDWD